MLKREEDGLQEIIPIEQEIIMFYGKPLIVVRLPDGRPGIVLRYLCDNMQLDTSGQIKRIRRTAAIANALVYVRIETEGGPQRMHTLVLRGVPYWLLGIDPNRARPEMREEILRYQMEAADVLYTWAQAPRAIAAPKDVVPSEPIAKPVRPADDAPLPEWHEYHLRMAAVIEWQMEVENWRGSVETQLEAHKYVLDLIPDILDRLGPQTLTPEHQNLVKYYVQQLSKATGKHSGTIYSSLYTAFSVPRYQDIPEEEWPKVENWFKVQTDRAKKK